MADYNDFHTRILDLSVKGDRSATQAETDAALKVFSDNDLFDVLRRRGYVISAWSKWDLEWIQDVLDDVPGAENLTEEQMDQVLAAAFEKVVASNCDLVDHLGSKGNDFLGDKADEIKEVVREFISGLQLAPGQ